MPASKLILLIYRALKNDKTESLKMNKGEFDSTTILIVEAKQELECLAVLFIK